MIECALNDAYTAADLRAVRVTLEEIAADARACQAVVAASVHFHLNRREGATRWPAPCSTPWWLPCARRCRAWSSPARRTPRSTRGRPRPRAAVRGWTLPARRRLAPLAEPGTSSRPELLSAGVAIEAGVFDAPRC